MSFSRRNRFEEKTLTRRLWLLIAGIITLIVFLLAFGLQIFVGFSLAIDKFRGSDTQVVNEPVFLAPPILENIPEATFSSSIRISGTAPARTSVTLFINNTEAQQIKTNESGTFTIDSLILNEGKNVIDASATDENNNTSARSNSTIVYVSTEAPILELTSPSNEEKITGEKNSTRISGKTEINATLTVNDRFVVVRTNGDFSYDFPLKEGTNELIIKSKSPAGMITEVKRTVIYQK